MSTTIVNTIFPVTQGFDSVPADVRPPYSPGAGANNSHPAGVEAGTEAPGLGLAAQSPPLSRSPASATAPGQTDAGAEAPGVGDADDSPRDDSNNGSEHGVVGVRAAGTALGRTDGGLLQPGGVPVNVVQDQVATQVFGSGVVQNVNGGRN
jgi:hypothetical protein